MALTTDMKIQKETFSNQSYFDSETQIRGKVADLEALGQSIRKRIGTQQFEYPIYSFRYGVNWRDLIGKDQGYIRAEMQRMIRETLAEDDRILSVDGFVFEFRGITCPCSFQVSIIFGQIREEVSVSV